MIKKIFLYIFLFSLINYLNAQETEISGKITELSSGEPIPYANIVYSGTYIGTMSDINGNYKLITSKPGKVIEVTAIGYKKQSRPIRIGEVNHVDFQLEEEVFTLEEIKILPGENPANILFRKIVANKDQNNPDNFPSWSSQIYAKTEIDIKNIKSKLKEKKLFKQFDFVFSYIDSLEMEGKTFLPVFFNETISKFYHSREENKDREEILANKASGMTSGMISQFTGKLYEEVNIYDNYITFSDIGFISPINNSGLQFYRYYLLDSALVNGKMIYEMSFKPKLPQEPAFKGKMWIEDGSFALTKLEMQLLEKANVNFINNFQYSVEFKKTVGRWVPRNEVMVADVDLEKNKDSEKMGIIGRKTNIYEDFKFEGVDQYIEDFKEAIVVQNDAVEKDNQYWIDNRPIELQQREQKIYQMVDSIKNVRLYKTAAEYVYMFFYGYRDLGKVELGPYYYLYSTNEIEGTRLRLGARTTYKFSEKVRLNGFLAYGTKDHEYKYGGGIEYFFSTRPYHVVKFQGQHDMEMLGKSDHAFVEQNIMTTLLRKQPNTKLNMVDRIKITAKNEWIPGLMGEISVSTSTVHSAPFVQFTNLQQEIVPSIKTSEISIGARYAPGEDIIQDDFKRNAFANYDPTISFNITKGFQGFLGGDYNYLKLHTTFSDKLTMNPFGYSTFFFQAGKIWGDVPYPLLKIHEGNETYAFDIYAFNLMNYQEFISDTYASLFLEHHFQGFFLNKIPLFRKLKWRETLGLHALIGSFDEDKHNQLALPNNMKGLENMPYSELSAGLENIFKIVKIDGVWRFSYNENVKHRFGLFVSVRMTL